MNIIYLPQYYSAFISPVDDYKDLFALYTIYVLTEKKLNIPLVFFGAA